MIRLRNAAIFGTVVRRIGYTKVIRVNLRPCAPRTPDKPQTRQVKRRPLIRYNPAPSPASTARRQPRDCGKSKGHGRRAASHKGSIRTHPRLAILMTGNWA